MRETLRMVTYAHDGTELAGQQWDNVFPAEVIRPDGTKLTACRAILLDDEIIIYVADADAHGSYARSEGRYATGHPRPHQGGWQADDRDGGGVWTVRADRASGCGCTSPLKNFPTIPPVILDRWPPLPN